jgi:hypothetical protein
LSAPPSGLPACPQKRAGAKGFGLFANADLAAGQFLIEYLGEVLEEEEYHRRCVRYSARYDACTASGVGAVEQHVKEVVLEEAGRPLQALLLQRYVDNTLSHVTGALHAPHCCRQPVAQRPVAEPRCRLCLPLLLQEGILY